MISETELLTLRPMVLHVRFVSDVSPSHFAGEGEASLLEDAPEPPKSRQPSEFGHLSRSTSREDSRGSSVGGGRSTALIYARRVAGACDLHPEPAKHNVGVAIH